VSPQARDYTNPKYTQAPKHSMAPKHIMAPRFQLTINCQSTKPLSIALHHAGSADTFERAFSWRKCALRELLAKMRWSPDLYKMCHECLHSFCGMLRHCSSMQRHASRVESVDASVLVLGGCALIMHKTGSYPALLRWLQKHLKVAFALCYVPVLLCASTLMYSLSTHIKSLRHAACLNAWY